MNEQLAAACAQLGQHRIVVIGDVMIDEYLRGEVRRISPEAPVPIVAVRQRDLRPGGAANSAVNVVALGSAAYLIGLVGRDPSSHDLRRALGQAQIDDSGLVEDPNRPTTCKTRIVAQNQQIVRIDHESDQPLTPALRQALLAAAESAFVHCQACIISDYGKGVVDETLAQAVIARAQAHQVPVIVDPKGSNYARYRGATMITPNVHEAGQAVGRVLHNGDEIDAAGCELSLMLPQTIILITRSADGISAYRNGEICGHFPARARHVFDVTGAGDTVVATLALAAAAALPLGIAIPLANLAAGIVVAKHGTASLTQAELLSIIANEPNL